MIRRIDLRRGLWVLLPMMGVVAVWVGAFWPSWRLWAESWHANPQYEHGPVLAAVSGVLMLRDLRLPAHAGGPLECRWAVVLAGASLAWFIAWLAGIAVMSQVLVLVCGWLLIRTALGRKAARLAVFPVFWLIFASELWEYAAVPLQSLTANAMSLLLAPATFPIHVEGAHVSVPAGEFVIEEGCSGVKYLITLLALACLIIRLGRFGRRQRWQIVGAAVGLALLANWLRVAALILIGQYFGLQHPLMHDHAVFGWALFLTALLPFVLIVRRLEAARDPGSGPPPPAPRAPLAKVNLRLGLGLVAVLAGPLLAGVVTLWGAPPRQPLSAAAEIQGVSGASSPPALHFVHAGAAGRDLALYAAPAGTLRFAAVRLQLPVASDVFQSLIESARGTGKPVTVASHAAVLSRTAQSVIRFSELESASASGARKIVRFWFENGGVSYARSSTAKFATALQALVGAGQMKIFVVESDCIPDCSATRQLLDGFMRGLPP